jgi:hypothetical protein
VTFTLLGLTMLAEASNVVEEFDSALGLLSEASGEASAQTSKHIKCAKNEL